MDPREFRLPRALRTADYRLTLSVSIADVDVLWSTAAARLLKSPGITVDDIDETIGSREDPSISDCLAALWEPLVPAGCVAEDMYLQAETPTVGTAIQRYDSGPCV